MVDAVRQVTAPPPPPPQPPKLASTAAAPYLAGWNLPASAPANPAPAPAPAPAPEPQGLFDGIGATIGSVTETVRGAVTSSVNVTSQAIGTVADVAQGVIPGDNLLSQGLRGALGGVEGTLRFTVGVAGGIVREGVGLAGTVGQVGTTLVAATVSPQARAELVSTVTGAAGTAIGATGNYLSSVVQNPSRIGGDLQNAWNGATGFVGGTAERYGQAISEGRTEEIGLDVGAVATYVVPVGGGPVRAALGFGTRAATEGVVRGGATLAARGADDVVASVVREAASGVTRSAANDTVRIAANDAAAVTRRAADGTDLPTLRQSPQPPARAEPPPADLHARAQMAEYVYGQGELPPGTRSVTSADELSRLNLSPDMLDRGAFHAEVYATPTAAGTDAYTIAFRGSGGRIGDWVSNGLQGLGLPSNHYARALEIGRAVGRADDATDVSFVGHSLGGGLASHAANASGRHAVTFNASGLNGNSISQGWQVAAQNGDLPGTADNFSVPGEILTSAQNTIPGLPRAFGDQFYLPGTAPPGASWLAQRGPLTSINRHGMDWVLASTASAR